MKIWVLLVLPCLTLGKPDVSELSSYLPPKHEKETGDLSELDLKPPYPVHDHQGRAEQDGWTSNWESSKLPEHGVTIGHRTSKHISPSTVDQRHYQDGYTTPGYVSSSHATTPSRTYLPTNEGTTRSHNSTHSSRGNSFTETSTIYSHAVSTHHQLPVTTEVYGGYRTPSYQGTIHSTISGNHNFPKEHRFAHPYSGSIPQISEGSQYVDNNQILTDHSQYSRNNFGTSYSDQQPSTVYEAPFASVPQQEYPAYSSINPSSGYQGHSAPPTGYPVFSSSVSSTGYPGLSIPTTGHPTFTTSIRSGGYPGSSVPPTRQSFSDPNLLTGYPANPGSSNIPQYLSNDREAKSITGHKGYPEVTGFKSYSFSSSSSHPPLGGAAYPQNLGPTWARPSSSHNQIDGYPFGSKVRNDNQHPGSNSIPPINAQDSQDHSESGSQGSFISSSSETKFGYHHSTSEQKYQGPFPANLPIGQSNQNTPSHQASPPNIQQGYQYPGKYSPTNIYLTDDTITIDSPLRTGNPGAFKETAYPNRPNQGTPLYSQDGYPTRSRPVIQQSPQNLPNFSGAYGKGNLNEKSPLGEYDKSPFGTRLNNDLNTRYAFQYDVMDPSKNNMLYGHRESGHKGVTVGTYNVLLPDGRRQIVSYTADSNGFKPDIRYEDGHVSVTGESGIRTNWNLNERYNSTLGYPSTQKTNLHHGADELGGFQHGKSQDDHQTRQSIDKVIGDLLTVRNSIISNSKDIRSRDQGDISGRSYSSREDRPLDLQGRPVDPYYDGQRRSNVAVHEGYSTVNDQLSGRNNPRVGY